MAKAKVLIYSKKAQDGSELADILGPKDYDVGWTDNGPETIIQTLSGKLEAVVIFLQARSYRELEYIPCLNSIDPSLPVIVVSDHDSLKLQREVRKHRVFYYLPQPVEAEEFRAVIHDAVATAARRR